MPPDRLSQWLTFARMADPPSLPRCRGYLRAHRRPMWPAWNPPRLTPRSAGRHFAPLVALTLGVVALAGVCLWGVFAG